MPDVIALGQPTVGDAELAAVAEVFASGWLSGAGPRCRELERQFAELCGVEHAVATSNCGSALHLAMRTLGVRPGDELIVADYTFPATGHAVMYAQGVPVFADVRPDTWTIDPAAVEAALTPRTVGIVAVDAFGQCADYDELQVLAERHGLFIIEDAACASGASYRGRPAGSLADVATFSFHGRKGISAGEGGAYVTGRRDLADHARKLHTYGIESALTRAEVSALPVPVFDELGYNYRLSDVAAAIMLVQLRRLPELLATRRSAVKAYEALLADFDLVTLPVQLDDREHVWQSYVLTLAPGIDRGAVAVALRERGVQCTFGTYASHLQPLYPRGADCPVSADLFRRHLAIPMHGTLTEAQVETVASAVRDVVNHAATA